MNHKVAEAAERYNGTPVDTDAPYKAGLTLKICAESDGTSETLVQFGTYEDAERFAEFAQTEDSIHCEFAEPEYEWSL